MIFILVILNTNVRAGIWTDSQKWLARANETDNINALNSQFTTLSGILYTIALIIAIIAVVFLGIKYMTASSSENKNEVKKRAIVVTVGVIILFSAGTIWSVTVGKLSSLTSTEGMEQAFTDDDDDMSFYEENEDALTDGEDDKTEDDSQTDEEKAELETLKYEAKKKSVKKTINPTKITLKVSASDIYAVKTSNTKNTSTITVKFQPSNTNQKNIKWTVSNNKKVNGKTLVKVRKHQNYHTYKNQLDLPMFMVQLLIHVLAGYIKYFKMLN